MGSEGEEGKFNRANRALYHFVENSMGMPAAIILNSFVYPMPVFFIVFMFIVGRLLYTQ
jgi:hypothetical protein